MSDYVPPENPYDTPQEEGAAPRRSPWIVVLVAVGVLIVAGMCVCGLAGLSWFAYEDTVIQPIPADLQAVPVDEVSEESPVLPPDPSEP